MRRRQSVRIQFVWAAVRAAIKFSDSARRVAPVMLFVGALFAGTCVWLTASAKAGHWVWKGWERMFGPSATANANPRALAQPDSSGTSGNYTITAIDEPSAGASATEGTLVFGVNASGAMTGTYSDQVGVGHGFVYANGTFTSFDAPNAGSSPPAGWFQGTVATGIDTAGDVVGAYADSNNAYHGFYRSASTGTITEFDDPNAPTATSSRGTFPLGINDAGQIVGFYTTGSYDTVSLYRGFLYSIANGSFTEIDEPNAGPGNIAAYQKEGTTPTAINASGTVTGFYVDSSGNRHGFIYSAGNYTSFDVAGATTNTGHGGALSGTVPVGIDAAGDVVGSYTDSNQVRHGFIRSAATGNPITTFDAPGANTGSQSGMMGGTFPTSIDPTGSSITGTYEDSSSLSHGFVDYLPLTAVASFTTFSAPNAATSPTALPFTGTGGFSVNASGTVVGFYLDSNGVLHGFEYTPTATPAPTFSPAQGTYSSEQSVTISDTDSAAVVYYTTDGSTPTVNSTKYTGAITVSSTETINAIALANGYSTSAVATATYTISTSTPTPAATPMFSPAAGTYTSAQTVTISDTTSGATIYYTTNGTTPTTSSTVYSGPITVSSSETIKAIATASGYASSAVATAAYTINSSTSTSNEWTWLSGSNTEGASGVYGVLGEPAAGNVPMVRSGDVSWIDGDGNFWIFGGFGEVRSGAGGYLNDFWKYTPSSGEWTWMGGSTSYGAAGSYGTLGTPAAGNIPGARESAVNWIDAKGNLWLFGGWGYDANGSQLSYLNDLWKYSTSIGQWTWVSGSNTGNQVGVYGTQGTPAAGNVPGARYLTVGWTDASGSFWLFGGEGYDPGTPFGAGDLNDLWKYTPSTGEWTWISGPETAEQYGVYGTEGTPAAGNVPGARSSAVSWTDSSGNFWLFGGNGLTASSSGLLNDLWKYSPSVGEWTWMSGSNSGGASGIYGTQGTPAAGNVPGARQYASSWTDSSGDLWLFGGEDYNTNESLSYLNDLWMYASSSGEWTWMGGSDSEMASGVYGTQGTPAAGNMPGARYSAVSGTDASGNLWLFGGRGLDGSGNDGYLNDLWEYTPPSSLTAAPTPTFSPVAGTYTSAQTVTISDATPGATIYYTTNGTTPTTSSTVYAGPITVSSSETLEAIAVATGYSNSAVASATYTINIPAAPVASLTVTGLIFSGENVGSSSASQNIDVNNTGNAALAISSVVIGGTNPSDFGESDNCGTPVPAGAFCTISVTFTPTATGPRSATLNVTDNSNNVAGSVQSASLSGTGLSPQTVYDVANSFEQGWSTQSNPNGVWSYGYSSGFTAPITLYTQAVQNGVNGPNAQYWLSPAVDIGNSPAAEFNDGAAYDDGNIDFLANEFVLVAGIGGQFSDLIFTAPATGAYSLSSSFRGDQYGIGTVVAVVVNGASVFNSTVTSEGQTVPFNTQINLNSGQTIVFSVGPGGGLQNTGLSATISVTPAATPTFSPPAGTYTSAQTVTISDATAGAAIYYTTNGTTPTTSSTVYTGPITVSSSETIEAIAIASGYLQSNVATATYVIGTGPAAATPTFSPVAGTYTSAQTVTITDATTGATIYYTTDGTTPTTSSTVYSSPITVSSTETIEAMATASGYANSAVASATYTINLPPGFGPPSGYQPGSISIQPGATTGNTATIKVVGTNGFSGTVNLTCAVTTSMASVNDMPTCSLNPTSVTLSGAAAQTSTLTVNTTAASSAVNRMQRLFRPMTGGMALALITLFLVPRRRRNWLAMLGALVLFVSASAIGCGGGGKGGGGGGGGGGNPGTTPGTYTITVTGASGTINAMIATVTLTVQ